jgi:hypothetical protein
MTEGRMPLYFAYGSNMQRDAMALRCPASHPIGPARLMRHRFVLMREGYASIVRDPGRVVHGLLWQLALRDVAPLDRYEGVAEGLYTKVVQSVTGPQGLRRALVYCGSNGGPGIARQGYMEAIVEAAQSLELPAAYLAELRTHVPGHRPAAAVGGSRPSGEAGAGRGGAR